MIKGYDNKIAFVDLSTQSVSYRQFDTATLNKYIGGSGLAARILWDETTAETGPLSAENLLIFMLGPLTGTTVPSSSRYTVTGISPLTGIWGKATAGGRFGYEMRHAGFDGIVIRGKSERPVYLWINDGQVSIRDAGHVWGTDTYNTTSALLGETDNSAGTVCIGQAGENLVKLACIMGDGKSGRAAARCGLGALMGSKKLKALVARGTRPVAIHDPGGLQESLARLFKVYPARTRKEEILAESQAILKSIVPIGGFPAKNWSIETFGEELLHLADDTQRAEPVYCKGCPYGCGESLYVGGGERHMVWEAWGPLGTNCLINNSESLQEAYSLCNRYGLDSISTGGVIGFAMECLDRGLITAKDTGGIELRWGNDRAMVEMVKKIALGEGFGAVLGEGVKRAGEQIGGVAAEYALHVKGLEFPAHDPRAAMGGALAYATGSIGATHMEAAGIKGIENYSGGTTDRSYPEFGYPAVLDRFAIEGKGELTAKTQDYGTMIDSLVVCLFLSWRFQPSDFTGLLNSAAGLEMDLKQFMLTGERIFNLIRMFNVRRGISRDQDTLPGRFLYQKRGSGGAADSLALIEPMLNDYYNYRGWSEEGIPTKETLRKLGLDDCLDYAVS